MKYAASKFRQSVVLRAQIPFSPSLHSERTQNNSVGYVASSVTHHGRLGGKA